MFSPFFFLSLFFPHLTIYFVKRKQKNIKTKKQTPLDLFKKKKIKQVFSDAEQIVKVLRIYSWMQQVLVFMRKIPQFFFYVSFGVYVMERRFHFSKLKASFCVFIFVVNLCGTIVNS